MTNGTADRLDRIEALLEHLALQQAQSLQQFEEVKKITESNARAVEANSSAISQMRQSQQEASEQFRQELREADERSRRRLEETTADVVSMIIDLGQQQSQTDQRFANLLQDARADRQAYEVARQANEREHSAFREAMQTLLTEIARIWQRLQAS